MEGLVYGVEVWGDYRATDWWRLSAGFNLQHEHLRFKPGSSGVGGLPLDGGRSQAPGLAALIDRSAATASTWDAFLRYVGKLPNPAVPEYVELDTRLGWKVTPALEHLDLRLQSDPCASPGILRARRVPTQVPRSFFVQTRWRF